MTELPKFHDGHLDGLRILDDHTVQLFLRDVGRKPFTLELSGVTRMGIWEVREGNILFDLVVRGSAEATPEDLTMLALGNTEGADMAYLSQLRESNLKMLEINASYGARGLVVFETYELRAAGASA
jgi:hypothetical protein